MKITDILPKRGVKVGMDSRDKSSAIKELVDVLGQVKDIGDKKSLVKCLVDREKLGSTGIGQGIAIPHAKSDKVNELIAILGISKEGVDYDALDGESVYIFFLLVAPRESAGPHLKALAQISRLLRDSYFCELLCKAKDSKDAYEILAAEEERKH